MKPESSSGKLNSDFILDVGWDSVVYILTRYWLEGPGIEYP